MRGALAVRINDGVTDRLVTQYVSDLKFRKTAPGGHSQATFRLTLPHDTFPDLGPADKVVIYDHSGAKVWEGYTEDPGVIDGAAGQSFDLSAMGGMVLASDESRAVIYVDYSFDGWERAEDIASAASAATDVSTRPTDGRSALLCQLNPGQPVGAGSRARMTYGSIESADQRIGGFLLSIAGGKIDGSYLAEVGVKDGDTPLSTVVSAGLTTVAAEYHRFAGVDFDQAANRLIVQLRRTGGATNVADDDTWAAFASLRVAGARVDRFGAPVVLATAASVKASEVVEDILGRLLPSVCDPNVSVVEPTAYAITSLAYKEGVTASTLLEGLAQYEPDMLWEILESTASGRHRFNYRAWPTSVRYEISTRDDYEAPGGEMDLCNRIAVYWADEKGKPHATVRGSHVPELGNRSPVLPDGKRDPAFVGRIRDAEPVTLPEGLGSAEDAARIGDQVLAAKSGRVTAAKAVVRRPILDRLTGLEVMPWEIEPGYLVHVRERGETLRLTETEYDDGSCATTLTLGEPVLTTEQRVARLWSDKGKAA